MDFSFGHLVENAASHKGAVPCLPPGYNSFCSTHVCPNVKCQINIMLDSFIENKIETGAQRLMILSV